jgi:hypothetical protein
MRSHGIYIYIYIYICVCVCVCVCVCLLIITIYVAVTFVFGARILLGRYRFLSTSTILILHFASDHRYKMSTRISTVYKCVKEHNQISKERCGAREHQV